MHIYRFKVGSYLNYTRDLTIQAESLSDAESMVSAKMAEGETEYALDWSTDHAATNKRYRLALLEAYGDGYTVGVSRDNFPEFHSVHNAKDESSAREEARWLVRP